MKKQIFTSNSQMCFGGYYDHQKHYKCNNKLCCVFKEYKRLFLADALPVNYLRNNLKKGERDRFVRSGRFNIPDGTVLSKNQLKVLEKDLLFMPCADKTKIHYHTIFRYESGWCNICNEANQINSLTKTFTVTSDMDCDCAICISALETGESYSQLECKHNFHKDCIQTWLAQSLTCPCCRKNYE